VISASAVFDAGPLITFHKTDTLWLTNALFTHVLVPPAVAIEIQPSFGQVPESFTIRAPRVRLLLPEPLGPGEREAIGLAMEVDPEFVVLDDHQARAAARDHGLPVTGTLGLLVRAKQLGLISLVRPLMHEMIGAGHYASDRLQELILEKAGEAQR
jgi:predicted nucleic acid-binding protein